MGRLSKFKLTAVRLRALLSAAILLITGAGAGLFIYASSWLDDYAEEVQAAVAESDSSNSILTKLESTQALLDKQQPAIERAQRIVVPTQQYEYQNHIITDLNRYASLAGVRITNIGFGQSDQAGSGGQNQSSRGESGDSGQASPNPGISAKSVSATVDLQTPLNYTNLLRFMSYVEQSLTKMQIKDISLQKAEGNTVSVQTLTIEIYTR